jgi:TRAP-type mannitol/chloroaromatic compound transport system permease small subunit
VAGNSPSHQPYLGTLSTVNKIKAVGHIVDNINIWVGRFMAILVLPLLGLTLFGVIMRYLVHQPLVWGAQILVLIFMPVAVLAGGYVLAVDGHVRVDVLYSRWGSRRKAIADAVTYLVFFLFVIILAWMATEMAWSSTVERESSWQIFHGPIYPKKIAFALAVVLLGLQGVVHFVRNIHAAIKGKETGKPDNEP